MKQERLTVQFFKKAIISVILAIIVMLITITIALAVKLNSLQSNLNKAVVGKTISQETVESLNYQTQFPKLYVESEFGKANANAQVEQKVVYLTFDDGPSQNTDKILDILDKYEVKATFFVVYKNDAESMKRMQRCIDEGHTIGIHSSTHKYSQVYESVNSYLWDFYRLWDHLKNDLGYEAKIFRFPGGSINAYNLHIYDRIVPEMYRRGFKFYDWNVSSGDAAIIDISADEIYDAVVSQVQENDRSIVLMHDSSGKDTTVQALASIIRDLQKKGYTFKALDNSVTPITFTS